MSLTPPPHARRSRPWAAAVAVALALAVPTAQQTGMGGGPAPARLVCHSLTSEGAPE